MARFPKRTLLCIWKEVRGGVFFFNLSFIYLFYLTILYWFCRTLTWIHHECTCVPHPEPPSLPLHPIPLGLPSAPAPSTLYHASNLDWRFVSHERLWFFVLLSAVRGALGVFWREVGRNTREDRVRRMKGKTVGTITNTWTPEALRCEVPCWKGYSSLAEQR